MVYDIAIPTLAGVELEWTGQNLIYVKGDAVLLPFCSPVWLFGPILDFPNFPNFPTIWRDLFVGCPSIWWWIKHGSPFSMQRNFLRFAKTLILACQRLGPKFVEVPLTVAYIGLATAIRVWK